MPYSLYIDSDSACCIFHPLWHCHSCLCCRDVVAIELLWLRDSLIVRGWAGVVKSIQCSEWFLPHTRQCWKLLSFFNQIGRASECEKVDRQNLLGVAIQPMLTLGVSRGGVGDGEHHGCGSEHHLRGVRTSRTKNFQKKLKVPGFWIWNFLKSPGPKFPRFFGSEFF